MIFQEELVTLDEKIKVVILDFDDSVQGIQAAKLEAKKEGRKIVDGDVMSGEKNSSYNSP
ncbi:hypothetical protein N9K77_01550 [bacterium]|nr:hypothetical protein [bacterium]